MLLLFDGLASSSAGAHKNAALHALGAGGIALRRGHLRSLTAVLAASAAAVPPRKPRRVVSMGVFVGGVLSTLSAWVIGFLSCLARVRSEAEVCIFPSACFSGT